MPVTVAIDTSYELIHHGLCAMLAAFPDRVRVVDQGDFVPADVVLWSAFGTPRPDGFEEIQERHRARYLAVLCWNALPEAVERCLAVGASGYLTTQLSASELVDALERIHRGETVVAGGAIPADSAGGLPDWPGQDEGLSERESDIVALVAGGLSNHEIAKQLFLSINTVKSYIRSAYRKMGVNTRSQAVLWTVDHGIRPRIQRGPRDLV